MHARIFLSPPHMGGEEMTFLKEAFESNWICPLGPQVSEFEREFAEYLGVKAALALNSGTSALHLGLKLCGVCPRDIVLCSSFTFAASANPILYEGGVPVFVDSEKESWNMCPRALELAINSLRKRGHQPRALILVHLYGQSADLDSIQAICKDACIPIIEDVAESLGATYKNRRLGSSGNLAVFSFNGNKIMTTSGGGMLVSNDAQAIEKARYWATQAREPVLHYEHKEIGYNYRLSNLLGAIGRGQLRVLDSRIESRRKIFYRYENGLRDLPGISFMPEASFGRSTRWLTVVRLNPHTTKLRTSHLIQALGENNIEARPAWKPLHHQPVFDRCEFYSVNREKGFCEEIFDTSICLPSGSNLSERDQTRIIQIIRAVSDAVNSKSSPSRGIATDALPLSP